MLHIDPWPKGCYLYTLLAQKDVNYRPLATRMLPINPMAHKDATYRAMLVHKDVTYRPLLVQNDSTYRPLLAHKDATY